ncbi:MAG: GIY-YIG nuclease family protein [Pyrinomonadaceae bacterium]
MPEVDKKRLKEEYRLAERPMGVFAIRNMTNERVFLGVSVNLNAIINRHRSQLAGNGHPNKRLQADWNEHGGDNFAFEILDQLNAREGSEGDYRRELSLLEDLWLEKLQPFGERGYNEPKLSREDRLRRIAANRVDEDA